MNPLPSLRPRLRDGLPFVYVNVATTADGKLAPANRKFVPFGSAQDHELLLELRTRCDAIMAGARTIDAVPVTLGPGGERFRDMRRRNGLAEHNLRVVVSGSGSLNPEAEIFKHTFSPIIVLVSERATKGRLKRLEQRGALVHVCGENDVDFSNALKWLRSEWGIKRLLCEGGGEINGALFEQGLVNEIYLTLCPLILGGRTAPTMADGTGVAELKEAPRLRRKAMQRVGDELYLVYSVLPQR